jgi:hypothetical protein
MRLKFHDDFPHYTIPKIKTDISIVANKRRLDSYRAIQNTDILVQRQMSPIKYPLIIWIRNDVYDLAME